MTKMIYIAIAVLITSTFVYGQEDGSPGTLLPNRLVIVDGLPSRMAESSDPTAVLAATLETIFHDPQVCCDKDSALGDTVLSAGSLSLEDLGKKLEGKRILSDGRSVMIRSEFLQPQSIRPNQVLALLMKKQPLIMEWNPHLYVLYGALFDETRYSTGRVFVIHKLYLLDVRFPDKRRQVIFDHESDDWNKVRGLLILNATPQ